MTADDWARYGLTRVQGRLALRERESVANAVHHFLSYGVPLEHSLAPEYAHLRPALEAQLEAQLRGQDAPRADQPAS